MINNLEENLFPPSSREELLNSIVLIGVPPFYPDSLFLSVNTKILDIFNTSVISSLINFNLFAKVIQMEFSHLYLPATRYTYRYLIRYGLYVPVHVHVPYLVFNTGVPYVKKVGLSTNDGWS